MADIIITGIVRSDGLIEVSEKVDLQPGQKVRLLVQPLSPYAGLESVTLEEAKIQIEADLKYELTEEERAAYHRAYDKLGASDNPALPIKIESVTLEEAKKRLPEERELTDEELAELKRAYELLDIGAENTGLPADYADELDHYLYGTPRRNPESD